MRSAFLLILASGFCQAGVLLTQEEALRLAFPDAASVERLTLFLEESQAKAVERAAKARMESRVITYYVGKSSTGILGYAFFETHTVRTMPETFMAVLNAQGELRFVELLAFHEPEDYKPPKKWLGLFSGKKLDNRLWVKRGIRNIGGATLTAQAVTDGVRRILAVYQEILNKKTKK